jgi:hypothetical protein
LICFSNIVDEAIASIAARHAGGPSTDPWPAIPAEQAGAKKGPIRRPTL